MHVKIFYFFRAENNKFITKKLKWFSARKEQYQQNIKISKQLKRTNFECCKFIKIVSQLKKLFFKFILNPNEACNLILSI